MVIKSAISATGIEGERKRDTERRREIVKKRRKREREGNGFR